MHKEFSRELTPITSNAFNFSLSKTYARNQNPISNKIIIYFESKLILVKCFRNSFENDLN